ncbi:DUF1178 family protein [Plastoroseomonas arctica]|uniref:DUF1178 family protein n=1 Tax=Plastoroseomonas arctica TaxID=1509237 RepID=A0AAF1JZI5_9PROT|nr:DUF1178 family protein [Plastoroseomonas arctica]MBR0657487.1 DUF1178 family protein [Plastoroseomonas arctica]
MIHYTLRCTAPVHGATPHEFEGWFKDSAAFEKLLVAKLVECPACGDTGAGRALMAPAIPKKGRGRRAAPDVVPAPVEPAAPPAATAGPMPAQVRALLQRVRAEVEASCDYVGDDFAEEARKMARGEAETRGIYGETSDTDAEALREEGIDVARIPWVPRSDA